MRTTLYSLLLGSSALGLLSGTLGLGISLLFVTSANQDEMDAGRVGFLAAGSLFAFGVLSLLTAFAVARRPGRPFVWHSVSLSGEG